MPLPAPTRCVRAGIAEHRRWWLNSTRSAGNLSAMLMRPPGAMPFAFGPSPPRLKAVSQDCAEGCSMKTERLYYNDPDLLEFDAHIVGTRELADRIGVILDRTAFYPTSGGQPNDVGMI